MLQDKPIVFFDIEATGVDPLTDRIVELAMVKINIDGTREIRTRRFNPTIPIPAEASAIHGIYDQDVVNELLFSQVAQNVDTYLEGCDLGGYNLINYDIPILIAEMKRANLDFKIENRRIIDSFRIFQRMVPRDLTEAYYHYTGKVLENAHSAEADILATVEVWEGQCLKYVGEGKPAYLPKGVKSFPTTLDEVHQFCCEKPEDYVDEKGRFRWVNKQVVVAFGKNRGTLLEKIAKEDPRFLQWIMRSDFEEEVKEIARKALMGEFPILVDA